MPELEFVGAQRVHWELPVQINSLLLPKNARQKILFKKIEALKE